MISPLLKIEKALYNTFTALLRAGSSEQALSIDDTHLIKRFQVSMSLIGD